MTARLLIVDDEKIALRNLEHVLTKEGYQVTATQTCRKAARASISGHPSSTTPWWVALQGDKSA